MKDILKMDLQYFAEDNTEGAAESTENHNEEQAPTEPTVSVAEMKRRLANEQARSKEEIERIKAQFEEERKKEQMSKDEKESYEKEQLKKELEAERSKNKRMESRSNVINKLSENELAITDDVLDLLVSDDNDRSLQQTDALVAYIASERNKWAKESARQEPPNTGYSSNNNQTESKSELFRGARKI